MKRTLYTVLLLTILLLVAACDEVTAALPDNGKLYIQLNGLPFEAKAGIIVTGPDDYEKEIDKEATLTDLEEGTYPVFAKPVNFGGETYTPDKDVQRPKVERNETTTIIFNYKK